MDLTRRPPRRVEPSAKHTSIPCITNSSWIGASKHDPPKQSKPRHSLPLPPKVMPTPIPQASDTSTSSTCAQLFYTSLPKKSLSPRIYSFQDDHLKLYRPAPPWSTLNERLSQEETAAMKRQEQHTRIIPPEEEIARVDMSNTKATLVKQQLEKWALAQSQLRRDDKERVVDVGVMNAETSLLSRNPFRRQQEKGVMKTLQPLIPISTVRVPILTPHARKVASAREEIDCGLKRKRIATEEQEDEADLMVKPVPISKKVTTSVTTSSGKNAS